jgi:4-hydroxybenzoate polyprenyltransferase
MYSNLLVGFVAGAFMLGTYAILELSVHLPLLVLACSGTFLVYQADRALFTSPEDRINVPERISWVHDHRVYVVGSSIVAFTLVLGMFPLVRPSIRWFVGGYAVLGFMYAILGFGDRFRSTGVHVGKPLVVALGWSFGGVLLPAVQADIDISPAVVLLVIYRLGFVLPNPLLADWADRAGDMHVGVFTPAAFLAERTLRRISQIILAVTTAAGLGAVVLWHAPALLWIDLLGPIFLFVSLSGQLPRRRWFYLVTQDGLMAWPAVTALVYFLW